MKKPTTDSEGRYNGYLVEIWNVNDRPDLQPSQVYLTAVAPHSRKGPHLHKVRRGMFLCLKGMVLVRTRQDADYRTIYLSGDDPHEPLVILPGVPCAIYNEEDETALLLNLPSPAWSKEDPDDWPVEEWID
jgi:hypothetical protein